MKRIITLLLISTFLFASCAGSSYTAKNKGCKGQGWYGKNKNLGPQNKSIKYKKR